MVAMNAVSFNILIENKPLIRTFTDFYFPSFYLIKGNNQETVGNIQW